jgi:crossover junction endodeoxyribonuclease RuvC
MRYIGIDPGKDGSISIIRDDGQLVVVPTPMVGKSSGKGREYDIIGMRDTLTTANGGYDTKNVFVTIERAQSMPGQGVSSTFEFGRGYGIWLGLLAALELPYQVIHARTWTRVMLMGASGEGKRRACSVAMRLFPQWRPKLKYEEEFADSILLAEFGRRTQQRGI